MRRILNIFTHALFWGSLTLLWWKMCDSVAEMLLYTIGMALGTVVCCLLRLAVNKLWIFITAHVSLIAGGILSTIFGELPLWFLIFFVAMVGYSFLLRCVTAIKDFDQPLYFYVGTAVAVYLVSWMFHSDKFVQHMSLGIAIIMFLMKLLYNNLKSADWFIESRNLSEDADAIKAGRFSKQISLMYTGAFSILVGMIAIISMDEVWEAIKRLYEKIMRYLVSLIPQGVPQVIGGTKPEDKEKLEGMGEMFGEAQASPFVQALDKIFVTLAVVVIAVVIVGAIVSAVISIYKAFYQGQDREEDGFVVEKMTAEVRVKASRKKKDKAVAESATARRIRKIYKKNLSKVEQRTRKDFPRLAPKQQVTVYERTRGERVEKEEICRLYEKARYSQETISDEDVTKMKTIM